MKDVNSLQFGKELVSIQEQWTEEKFDKDCEPLDGDDVDRLSWIIKIQLNLLNGNITEEEKDDMIDFMSEAEYLKSLE